MTVFEKVCFITAKENSGSSQFRKKFHVGKVSSALLRVCALGYGYFWLNGKRVSEDLFTAPVSDYRKTLWYSEYDVSSLLNEGENVFAVWLGNGFFNESFESAWNHDKVSWREDNKFILELIIDGKNVVCTDESWKSNAKTAVVRNELRSGETFDFRLYDESWTEMDFKDSEWGGVTVKAQNPAAILRKCCCQPIREIRTYKPKSISDTANGKLIDFGTNFAGYVRLRFCEKNGNAITIKHAENVNEKGELQLNGLDVYYPSVPFQTEIVLCDGKQHVYSPLFTYHGFRYVEISGLKTNDWSCEGVEVRQDIERIADFSCSDERLNKLYDAAIRSSLSNFHYAITDCPTREKLGWGNDATASLPQFLINFDIVPLLKKWYQDIIDTQRADGAVSGIAPTPDWGYEYGAVTDIYLFAIPSAIYESTGDGSLLVEYQDNLIAYYDYYYAKVCLETPQFILGDWNGATNYPTDLKFIELAYALIMQRHLQSIKTIDERLDVTRFIQDEADTLVRLCGYFEKDGSCKQRTVTSVSMAMCLGLGNFDVLKKQLIEIVEKQNGDIGCGMVGRQFFFKATSLAGLTSLALKVLTRPESDYQKMVAFEDTLWETSDETAKTVSHNHHMYSNFVEVFFNDVLGIKERNGKVEICPDVHCGLTYAKGYRKISGKELAVEYRAVEKGYAVTIACPKDEFAAFNGEPLKKGVHTFLVKN